MRVETKFTAKQLPSELRLRRVRAGLSLRAVAQLTGISVAKLSYAERGVRALPARDRRLINRTLVQAFRHALRKEVISE